MWMTFKGDCNGFNFNEFTYRVKPAVTPYADMMCFVQALTEHAYSYSKWSLKVKDGSDTGTIKSIDVENQLVFISFNEDNEGHFTLSELADLLTSLDGTPCSNFY